MLETVEVAAHLAGVGNADGEADLGVAGTAVRGEEEQRAAGQLRQAGDERRRRSQSDAGGGTAGGLIACCIAARRPTYGARTRKIEEPASSVSRRVSP